VEEQRKWVDRTSKALALMFAASGMMKLAMPEKAQQSFDQWGYPDWLRITVALWELECAGLLAFRYTRWLGAIDAAFLMAGATFTHAKTEGERAHAAMPLSVMGVLGWILYQDTLHAGTTVGQKWTQLMERSREALRPAV